MLKFDVSNLPEDPREDGYVRAHDRSGRAADIQEVNEAFHLQDPDTGIEYDMPEGGFLVWRDGEWSAEERSVILGDHGWDISDKGVWGKGGDGYPSVFEQDALDHPDESSDA